MPSSIVPFAEATTLALPADAGTINDLAWSSTGEQIAAVTSEGSVWVWETASGRCILQQNVTKACLTSVAWSPQARCLLIGSEQGTLSLLQLSTHKLTPVAFFPEAITSVAWSPSIVTSRFLVVTGSTLRVFTHNKREPFTFSYSTPLLGATWSPPGDQIALVCANGLVEIWNALTQRVVWQQTSQGDLPLRVSWDGTGHRLAIGTCAGTVQIQDLRTQQSGQTVMRSRFPIHLLQWGERYLVAGGKGDFTLWNEAETQTHRQLTAAATTCAFDPDGVVLATAQQGRVALAVL